MPKLLKILVTDEEAGVRLLLRDFLSQQGYQVLLAEDGEEALRLIQEHEIDLVIADLRTPKLCGPEVYESACRLRPKLCKRFIFTGPAAGSATQVVHEVPLAAKPFQFESLSRTIRKISQQADPSVNHAAQS